MGTTAGSAALSEGLQVITLAAIGEDTNPGSESVVIEDVDPLNHDGDDADATVLPTYAEVCDAIDPDWYTAINEAFDGFLWVGAQLAISVLSIQEPADEDWYENADFSVSLQFLPSVGTRAPSCGT